MGHHEVKVNSILGLEKPTKIQVNKDLAPNWSLVRFPPVQIPENLQVMMTIDPWLKIGADQDLRIDIIQLTQIDWSYYICFLSNKIKNV